MRILIADSDLSAGRNLAASIERMLPAADVLLYDETEAALEGLTEHRPDVVFVAPEVGADSGPDVVSRVCAVGTDTTVVGMVDAPDPTWSTRYVDAGAGVVVARPPDDLAIRTALRQRAGGIPGDAR